MRLYKNLVCTAALLGTGMLCTFPLAAQTAAWEKITTVTIDQPIEVPGAGILQPGAYTFKLVDPGQGADRHTVQILNKEQTHVFATFQAIPNERLRPTGKTVFSFYEVPAGQPEVMRAWFYPGDNFGQEFAYPKGRAAELSKLSNQQVPTETAVQQPQTAQVETAPQVAPAPEPAPAPAPVAEAPAPAPQPAPVAADTSSDNTVIAQNTAPPPAVSDSPQSAPQELPQTGSDMPLTGALGLGLLVLAGCLRFASIRS